MRMAQAVNTVVLVDDHELIRQGLARAFERHADFTVLGEAGTVAEGRSLARDLKPSVVVTDVRLPASRLTLLRCTRATTGAGCGGPCWSASSPWS